jgi:hypothetical protein
MKQYCNKMKAIKKRSLIYTKLILAGYAREEGF